MRASHDGRGPLRASPLNQRFFEYLRHTDALRDVIHEGLPKVLSLSRENFSIFASSSAEAAS